MMYFVNAQTTTLDLTDLEDKFHNYIISILKAIKVSIIHFIYYSLIYKIHFMIT